MADIEGVKQRVQQILLDADLKLQLNKDAIMVPYESTMVVIVVNEMNDKTVVQLRGMVAQSVPLNQDLKDWVAERTGEWIFGHPVYLEEDGVAYIEFRHSLLGDFLDPGELMVALGAVATTADAMDDEIHDRFGGERWIDPHLSE
ncbi:MAG: YbjN domain-containing protein [Actinomycetota bacterium]|nr:YbjN domain-containing protein [Actinomycetota bacterium]